MSEPLVSVHMITYNHEKYLAQAMEGAISQKTNFPFEIIIGEDCSTDRTRDIVSSYYKKYPQLISVITSDKNIGAIKNSSRITNACKGKYIAYCDSDDYWHTPYKLQEQVGFLESHLDYGLVHSDFDFLYQKKNKIIKSYNRTNKIIIPEGNIFEDLLNPNYYLIRTVTVCLRRQLLINYFDYNVAETRGWLLSDLPLWLEIARHSKIGYIAESLATYRLLEESLSNTRNAKKRYQLHLSVADIREYYAKKYGCTEKTRGKMVVRRNRVLLADSFLVQDRKALFEAYLNLKSLNAKISLKEYIFFFGTKSIFLRPLFYYLYKLSKILQHFLQKLTR